VTERYILRVNVSGDTEWRWADPSGQQRLVRTDELRAALASGVLAPNTPVWRQGWPEWRPATEVPELTTSALAAANGVLPNIPPPPMNVVAAQHAFEGEPIASIGKSEGEPPPPPSYVPAATQPPPDLRHTPSQRMRVAASVAGSPGKAPHYAVNANNAVSIRALNEGDADALVSKHAPAVINVEPSAKRPDGGDLEPDQRKTLPNAAPTPAAPPAKSGPPPRPAPSHPPPTIGISSLVRSSPPPAVAGGRVSSKPPPPPRLSKPPPKAPSKAPPRPEEAGKEVIEELSGSVLLADQSASQDAIEELSGSILLPDQSGSVQTGVYREGSNALLLPDLSGPAPAISGRSSESSDELSGSFLLEAGSTGALPSVESTGKILAAKAASRAPFAPRLETPSSRPSAIPAPIVPIALPLGSTPPPPPSHVTPGALPPASGVDGAARADAPSAAPEPHPLPDAIVERWEQRPSHVATLRQFQPEPPPPSAEAEPFMVEPTPAAPEVKALATLVGVPPPPSHVLAEAARAHAPPNQPLPPPERSTARLHDFRAMGHDPRAPYILAAFGVVGILVFIGVIGLIVSAFQKKGDEPAPVTTVARAAIKTPPPATATATATTVTPEVAPAPAPAPPPGALGAPCTLAGAAHVIAPRAIVQSGVETSVVGSRLALGFAAREKEGFAVAIDPSSAVAAQTVRARAPDAIRRLVPISGAHGLTAAADVDRSTDFLGGRRTIPAQHPFDLGFGGGGLAWAPYGSAEVYLLWTLDGSEPVEALRAAPLDPMHEETGWAIAFRRGSTIYAGAVGGSSTFAAKGPLVKIAGLGPQVGSPAVAAQDGAVLVAWADRAQPTEPWSLRWMRFAPGDASGEAKGFVPGGGGLGEHAMSPAIAAAGQGRFVIAWTEGPVSNHQVRAETITGSGVALGTAMGISDSGVNAGQAELAILPDGHGVVAYLASSGGGAKASYEVLATPIVCP
jgi:GYF domain 2